MIKIPLWDVARKAKTSYEIGLLTNMAPRMLAAINQSELLPKLSWNAVVDSSDVGYQKPDYRIFEIAELKAGVEPNELFFVDNIPSHVAAAQERGWKAALYDPHNPIESSKKIEKWLNL